MRELRRSIEKDIMGYVLAQDEPVSISDILSHTLVYSRIQVSRALVKLTEGHLVKIGEKKKTVYCVSPEYIKEQRGLGKTKYDFTFLEDYKPNESHLLTEDDQLNLSKIVPAPNGASN